MAPAGADRTRRRSCGRSLLLALLAIGAAMLAIPGVAAATDTMSLSLAPAVPGQDVIVNAMGSTDASFPGGSVSMTYKPAGGSCAATPAADTGTALDINPFSQPGLGEQTFGTVGDFTAPGTGNYLICAWLADSDGNVYAAAQAIQVVGAYQASLTIRVLGKGAKCVLSPWASHPLGATSCEGTVDAQELELVADYTTNAQGLLTIDFRPASGPGCASSPTGEPSDAKFITQTMSHFIGSPGGPEVTTVENYYVIGIPYNAQEDDGDPGSPFTQVLGATFGLTNGRWLVCAWISRPGQEINAGAVMFGPVAVGPIADTFSFPTTTTTGNSSGTGGCVVPKLKGRKLAAARSSIKTAGCRVGKLTHKHAARSRRGRIIGQSPAAGSHEPAGTKVNLVVGK